MHARFAKHRMAASQNDLLFDIVLAAMFVILIMLFALWAWSVVAFAMRNADSLHPLVTTAIFLAYAVLLNKAFADRRHRREQREIRNAVRSTEKELLARIAGSVTRVIHEDAIDAE